ncbi:MAG: lipoate--protein ligase family protein [Candidatus Bathyarchaeota archaeon]|jgi:lipoate-protein ligase A|nr:lipoate--protein ligase family protein [Candidatus Bathyarchaeota archaeon A05DMB-3]MDH7606987.1 lipoate--protein ligase family protein [Candidatus Bathyarchaeota archaeon]
MAGWRLLKFETYNAYMNMAIDEAILNARIKGLVPNTVRFYRWNPSTVSIGKFQKIENEVYLENCLKHGVDVVRRITGGGTVYHDAEGEITYSVIANKEDLDAKDIAEVYTKIYAGIVEALKILGLKADFNKGDERACPNLTIKGKKISGSAQCHKTGIVLQHGTILVDVNLEKMFTYLKVPWAKTCMEIVPVAKNKITSIKTELGKTVSLETVHKALIKGFQKALKTRLENGDLIAYETELVKKLYKEKYATTEWNLCGKEPCQSVKP